MPVKRFDTTQVAYANYSNQTDVQYSRSESPNNQLTTKIREATNQAVEQSRIFAGKYDQLFNGPARVSSAAERALMGLKELEEKTKAKKIKLKNAPQVSAKVSEATKKNGTKLNKGNEVNSKRCGTTISKERQKPRFVF